jgi:hypothetical protein
VAGRDVARPDAVLTCLAQAAADGYRAAFPDADLVTFTAADVGFLFDHSTDAGRVSRTVSAWTHAHAAPSPRDRTRQAGFPLQAALAEAGYERGHLIAHAAGGGLDANVFAQARHVNRGWSPDGRRYRNLERLAAANPGSIVFHRLIYGDATDVPDLNELTVIVNGEATQGVFDNRPLAWPSPAQVMRRGRHFHDQVQTDFLLALTGASAYPEHQVNLTRSRRGRVDLQVVPEVGERYAVVIEIKSTDWDALAERRVRPNLRSHIRQLQGYLDRYIDDIGTAWDSVTGALLYLRRPTKATRLQLIDELTSRESIMIVWYDETDWIRKAETAEQP